MADDNSSDLSPLDYGAMGLLGARGLAAAGSGFRAIAPYLGKAAGMFGRLAAGPVGAGVAAGYEVMRPVTANAGEQDLYTRGPDGQMVPNPQAVSSAHAAVDDADNTLPQPTQGGPSTTSTGGGSFDGQGDPWLGKSAAELAGPLMDDGSRTPITAQPTAGKMPANGGRAGRPSDVTGPGGGGGGFFDSLMSKLHDNSNLMLGLGAGMTGKRSFGEAMSGGFAGAAQGSQMDIAQQMQMGGIRAAYQELVSRGVDPRVALAAAYNKELYSALTKQAYPEPKVVDTGQDKYGVQHKGLQMGTSVVSMERAMAPHQVQSFEEALRLPKGVYFRTPDGRVFER